jgi:tetratricopeptide (TPR) repeat protein
MSVHVRRLAAAMALAGLCATSAWGQGPRDSALRQEMARRGIPVPEIVVPFAWDAEIARFAGKATSRVTDPLTKADALYDALSALKQQGALVTDRDNSPKARLPKTARDLFAAAMRPGSQDRIAGCYELTVLFVAAARSVGLEALGVRREQIVASGQIGHVMAAVRAHPQDPLALYDLQNNGKRLRSAVRELDDLELVAQHYSHLSVAYDLRGDYRAALREIGFALALAPDEAGFLANRATVLAALGETELAAAEATAAVERAPRIPVFRYTLGRLLLALGDLGGARASLEAALELYPAYSLARRDLGWALLLSGDFEEAERELVRAARVSPAAPEGELYLGLYYLTRGRRREATQAARQGLQADPLSPALSALLSLATGGASPPSATAEVKRLEAVLDSVRVRTAALKP